MPIQYAPISRLSQSHTQEDYKVIGLAKPEA